jgi:hypothetical protein
MEIEKIIYETTREIYNIEDKLKIATIFLFCEKLSRVKFAELLYTKNHIEFIDNLNQEYQKFDVDFTIRFNDKNVNSAFYKTLMKVIEKEDSNGFLKVLHEKDEFAIVIDNILETNFSEFEKICFLRNIGEQLKLF